jgi:hypothetical protein
MPIISVIRRQRTGGSQLEASLSKKLARSLPEQVSQAWWYASVIPADIGKRIISKVALGKNERPYLKKQKQKQNLKAIKSSEILLMHIYVSLFYLGCFLSLEVRSI